MCMWLLTAAPSQKRCLHRLPTAAPVLGTAARAPALCRSAGAGRGRFHQWIWIWGRWTGKNWNVLWYIIYIYIIYIYHIYIYIIYIYHILINIWDMIKDIWYMIYDSRWHFRIAIKLILRNGSLAKNKWWFRHQHTMNWVCPQMLEVYCNIWP